MRRFKKEETVELSQNQKLVMSVLENQAVPMSAYMILEELRKDGLKAPLQVYRALEKLISFGMAHRLESLNAFIACSHMHCEASCSTAFVICDRCEHVQEICDDTIADFLSSLAQKTKIKTSKSNIELHGICDNCSEV